MCLMALGALMAADPMKRLPKQAVQNPPVIFTTTTAAGHRRHLPSSSQAAKPTASPSDPDVAAARQLVQLSSDGDANGATLLLPDHNQEQVLPRDREEAPTTNASMPLAGGTPKGNETDAAASPLAPRRKRRFASISSIYARTKPLMVRGSGPR